MRDWDQQLEEFLKAHTDARLIIIDTLQKVKRGRRRQVQLCQWTMRL